MACLLYVQLQDRAGQKTKEETVYPEVNGSNMLACLYALVAFPPEETVSSVLAATVQSRDGNDAALQSLGCKCML
jgi:hypothetical protein